MPLGTSTCSANQATNGVGGSNPVEPAPAGMAQQRDVDRQSEPVLGTAPRRNQVQVFVGQNVVALQ